MYVHLYIFTFIILVNFFFLQNVQSKKIIYCFERIALTIILQQIKKSLNYYNLYNLKKLIVQYKVL